MSPFSPVSLDLRTLHPELKRPPPPRTTSSSTLRTGHACTHPGIQSLHEFLVRERRGRTTTAGRPGPEDERVRLHVLDDIFTTFATAIAGRVFHLLADISLRLAFPQHRQRCQVPVRHARYESVGGVRRLVAGLARLRGRAVAVLSADDQRSMNDLRVRLPRRLILVAVDAPRMSDDACDGFEEGRIRGRCRRAARKSGG